MSHKTRHHSRWRSVFLWHRYIGLGAALFVILLAGTGILLNHTDRLGLQERRVDNDWLMNWYGIKAPQAVSFATAHHRITQLGRQVYFDAMPLPDTTPGTLVGVLEQEDIYLLAYQDAVELWSPEAELIDRLRTPSTLSAIGRDAQDAILIRSLDGLWMMNADMTEWQQIKSPENPGAWATASDLPESLDSQLKHAVRGEGLPLERVLLDLHSGRIFGQAGVFIMDLSALLMIFLGMSGLWIWVDRLRKRRAHRKGHH